MRTPWCCAASTTSSRSDRRWASARREPTGCRSPSSRAEDPCSSRRAASALAPRCGNSYLPATRGRWIGSTRCTATRHTSHGTPSPASTRCSSASISPPTVSTSTGRAGTAQLTARVPPSHRAPSTSLRDGSRGGGPLRACAAHTRARRASCTRSTHNGGVMHGGTAPPSRASRRAPTGTAPAHPPSAPGYLPAPHRARGAKAHRQR
mmetsp:Transcript_14461/g.46397  ORF Transcript_14461/g.46397 Transcript_14461/m.46397 type:complete len:207 (-) Transcript_14461:114-734(-)